MSSTNIDDTTRLEYDRYRELYAEDQKAKQAKSNSIWGAVISASVGASGMIPVMTIGFAAAAYYYWTTQDGADERRKRMWTIEQDFERRGYANPAWGQLRRIEE